MSELVGMRCTSSVPMASNVRSTSRKLVLVARPARRRRHRVDEFGGDPVHVAPQMPVHLSARTVALADREPERRRQMGFRLARLAHAVRATSNSSFCLATSRSRVVPAMPSAHVAALRTRLGADGADQQLRAARLHGRRAQPAARIR